MRNGRSAVSTLSRWFLVALVATVAMPGCAPSDKEVAEAHFGPAPDHVERLIEQQMDLTVFGGSKGDYVFKTPPYRAAVKRSLLSAQEFGWVVEFEAKGPIAFGSGGYRTYHYFFPSDETMALLTQDAVVSRIDK